jgi:hypothetical protein
MATKTDLMDAIETVARKLRRDADPEAREHADALMRVIDGDEDTDAGETLADAAEFLYEIDEYRDARALRRVAEELTS